MHDGQDDDASPALVTNRTMELVVALLFLVASAIVITDSWRLGVAWKANEGPAPGYFPFYIGLAMAVASLINLIRALPRARSPLGTTFVSRDAFKRVVAVLVPAIVYVALVGGLRIGSLEVPGLGIYAASAAFIVFFMIAFGGASLLASIATGVGVALALLVMFEVLFLTPLPKNPFDDWIVASINTKIAPVISGYVAPFFRAVLRLLRLV